MSLREQKKKRTREAIIEAARKLFAEKGYEETRTREIAEAAGIATGTLFNYAPTKSDVVLLLWKARAAELAKNGLALARQQEDEVEALVVVFGPIFDFYAEDIELGRIFLQQAIYASKDDPEMAALHEGFIASLAVLLMPRAGMGAALAASNVFGAYYLTLTMLLAGRLSTSQDACAVFRELVRAQASGWGAG